MHYIARRALTHATFISRKYNNYLHVKYCLEHSLNDSSVQFSYRGLVINLCLEQEKQREKEIQVVHK